MEIHPLLSFSSGILAPTWVTLLIGLSRTWISSRSRGKPNRLSIQTCMLKVIKFLSINQGWNLKRGWGVLRLVNKWRDGVIPPGHQHVSFYLPYYGCKLWKYIGRSLFCSSQLEISNIFPKTSKNIVATVKYVLSSEI